MPNLTISTLTIPPTTTMSAHIAAHNPHPQYLMVTDLANAAKVRISLEGLMDVGFNTASDGALLVNSHGMWQLTNIEELIANTVLPKATTSTYGVTQLAIYPDIINNVSSTVITPDLLSSYASYCHAELNRNISVAISTSIAAIPYATTATSGLVRLISRAEVYSDTNAVVTPPDMRFYVSNYHDPVKQNKLIPSTGIAIDQLTDKIYVSEIPISDVTNLGTSLTNIDTSLGLHDTSLSYHDTSLGLHGTSLANLETSKQLKLAREGTYISISTSTINENTNSETQVDVVNCTIPPASVDEPGIVSLVSEITEDNKSDISTAVTPNALTDALGSFSGFMSGFHSVMWRHVAPGLFTSTYIPNGTEAENTSGYYKLSNCCVDDSLCLTIAWGKTELLQISGTCMYDIDIRPSGMCKLQHVIAPILNVECYGGPEYYVLQTSAGGERVVANNKYRHGGVNYDVLRQTGGDSTQITADFSADAARKIYPIDITNPSGGANYPYMAISKVVITGRGKASISSGSSTYFQCYELDNMVPQYAAALHQKSHNENDGITNPITHLRVIFNRINTNRPSTIFVHWCVIGLAPIAYSIWDGTNYNTGLPATLPDVLPCTVTCTTEHKLVHHNGENYWDPDHANLALIGVVFEGDVITNDGIYDYNHDNGSLDVYRDITTNPVYGNNMQIQEAYGNAPFSVNLPVKCLYWHVAMGKYGSERPGAEVVIAYTLSRNRTNEADYLCYNLENLAFVFTPANQEGYILFKKVRIDINDNGTLSIDPSKATITTNATGGFSVANVSLNKFTYGANAKEGGYDITDAEGVPTFNWVVASNGLWKNPGPIGTIFDYEYHYDDRGVIWHRAQFIMGYTDTRIIFKVVLGAYDKYNEHATVKCICSDPSAITFRLEELR